MTPIPFFLAAALSVLLLGGCAQRSDQIRTEHPISVGMTTADVVERWGRPRHVDRLATPTGTAEVWYYPDGVYPVSVPYGRLGSAVPKFLSVYVRDGRVVAIERRQ